MSKPKKKKFAFAFDAGFAKASNVTFPSMHQLYEQSLRNPETMRKTIETAANAAFENLMSWERIAITLGYEFEVITHGCGCPVPHVEDNKVTFIQSYGVRVKERKDE